MGNSLTEQQTADGAIWAAGTTVPMSFGNDETARTAADAGVALCDRSHWGRLRVSGDDRLRFLHNQTTNELQSLAPGQGCDTVFVSSTGRTLDLATAYVEADSVLLLVSPGQAPVLNDWMDRYIFFADKVTLADETDTTVAFTLLGPESLQLLTGLGITDLEQAPQASHCPVTIGGVSARLAVGSGLAQPGFTLIAAAAAGADLWQALVTAGATPLGEQVWQALRIQQGRPLPGAELTEDYNPLEAALWQAISFDKGCYIGQETIARLQTYQGVKQQLWGLRLAAVAEPGTPILLDEQKVGIVTSCVETPTEILGLGYIRTKAGGEGLTVVIAEHPAEVVAIAFATRGYLAN
ncbi:MAG: YgfZ/GcvT domain-containing protein [Leptolyngbyaceae cyanobacterium]